MRVLTGEEGRSGWTALRGRREALGEGHAALTEQVTDRRHEPQRSDRLVVRHHDHEIRCAFRAGGRGATSSLGARSRRPHSFRSPRRRRRWRRRSRHSSAGRTGWTSTGLSPLDRALDRCLHPLGHRRVGMLGAGGRVARRQLPAAPWRGALRRSPRRRRPGRRCRRSSRRRHLLRFPPRARGSAARR